ncbi:glutathione transferase GST 23-like [Herrania umbratica]|uniref:Glutathione S-transferase n=1 Tax=Herrania umbratica TaxID=108875 RepID=A0A6J1B078_9ROSI|nr:glutathione transferase GST 23-like [Herrania umbratica]
MAELKLIASSLSCFCTRIEWALKLKGVEYEYLEEDLRNKSPLLLTHNPVHKKVPVLLHNGKPIAESLIILEYTDETWKDSPLLPEDPYEKAMARFWAKFGDEKCLLGAFDACRAEGDEKEKFIESAVESFAFLEKQLEGKKYFGGEQIGYLDLALGWIPHWLNVIEEVGCMKLVDAQRTPLLHQWGQEFMEIPLIKECVPPRDKLLDRFAASIIYLRSLAASQQ